MEDEKLIECVRCYQYLYNLNHPKSMDNAKKDLAWKEISLQMKAPAADCKLRWQGLRDAYRRALNKRKPKNGPATKIKKWKFEEEMAFLTPYLTYRKKEAEGSEDEDDEPDGYTQPQQDSWIGESSSSIYNDTAKESESALSPDTTALLISHLLEERKQNQKKLDVLDHFFLSISATCKKFSPYTQVLLKRKIFNLVSEIEIQQVTAESTSSPNVASSAELQDIKFEITEEAPNILNSRMPEAT